MCSNWDKIRRISTLSINFLQYPIQLQFWILLLIFLGGAWTIWTIYTFISIRRRNKIIIKITANTQKIPQSAVSNKEASIENTHEIRELLGAIYKKLINLREAFDLFTMSPEHQRQQHREQLNERLNDFRNFFLEKQIFLPKVTTGKVWQYSTALNAANLQYSMALAEAKSPHRTTQYWRIIQNLP
jgi:hypothetical protein